MMLFIILVLIVAIGGYIILTYNRLLAQIEAIRDNQKQLDIQLDRRFRVFESLITVVQKYIDYEKTALKDVMALHSQALESSNTSAKITAENQITEIANHLNVVFEQYPNLKAHKNMIQLQDEIVRAENKLAYAKHAYNDSVEMYVSTKHSFPASIIVSTSKAKLQFDFPTW